MSSRDVSTKEGERRWKMNLDHILQRHSSVETRPDSDVKNISKARGSANREDVVACFKLGQLENGSGPWENIPEVVRNAFCTLLSKQQEYQTQIQRLKNHISILRRKSREDTTLLQVRREIDDLMVEHRALMTALSGDVEAMRTEVREKVDKTYVDASLQTKANRSEGFFAMKKYSDRLQQAAQINALGKRLTLLERRREPSEGEALPTWIHPLRERVESIEVDLEETICLLNQKAGVNEVNEALARKASKRSIVKALEKKLNRRDFEGRLRSAVSAYHKRFQQEGRVSCEPQAQSQVIKNEKISDGSQQSEDGTPRSNGVALGAPSVHAQSVPRPRAGVNLHESLQNFLRLASSTKSLPPTDLAHLRSLMNRTAVSFSLEHRWTSKCMPLFLFLSTSTRFMTPLPPSPLLPNSPSIEKLEKKKKPKTNIIENCD